MNLFRSRTLLLLVTFGLAALSLRPFGPAEKVLAILLVPCRGLVELVVPIEWFQTRRALAAQSDVLVDAEEERARHLRLEQMVRDSALPAELALPEGAVAFHGEVVGRDRKDLDRVHVRTEGCRGLVPGLPVVSGDWFVGVVRAVRELEDGSGSELDVQLITDHDERIAARVEPGRPGETGVPGVPGVPSVPGETGASGEPRTAGDPAFEPCRLVAGGLAPRVDTVWLDVHNPSRREVHSGRVVVDERAQLGGRYTSLANGSWLGELVAEEVDGKQLVGIRPGLDYGSGLYQVLVLAPEGLVQSSVEELPLVLDDGLWHRARRFLRAETSPWRQGVWVALGRRDGVRPGAAVAAGARFCGRLGEVGLLRSSVLELGDPGLAIAALAIVERDGRAAPFVMGRIESRGRGAEDTFVFHWDATVPLEGTRDDPPVYAELWTGSGEPGVPRGLWVGTTHLPRGPGPHRIVVRPPDGMARAGRWRARLEPGAVGTAGGA